MLLIAPGYPHVSVFTIVAAIGFRSFRKQADLRRTWGAGTRRVLSRVRGSRLRRDLEGGAAAVHAPRCRAAGPHHRNRSGLAARGSRESRHVASNWSLIAGGDGQGPSKPQHQLGGPALFSQTRSSRCRRLRPHSPRAFLSVVAAVLSVVWAA